MARESISTATSWPPVCWLALRKRPVSTEAVEAAIARIEEKLLALGEREVASEKVGEMVMRELKKLDKVAYVRFASVYRNFEDVDEFSKVIREVSRSPQPARSLMAPAFSAADHDSWRVRCAWPSAVSTRPPPIRASAASSSSRWQSSAKAGTCVPAGSMPKCTRCRPLARRRAGRPFTSPLNPAVTMAARRPAPKRCLSPGWRGSSPRCRIPIRWSPGRGWLACAQAGVLAECGLLAAEAQEINIGFVARMTRARPWLRMKLAASLDGKTALQNGASQWLTGAAARQDGHRWRARACAILTGIGTVRHDDPQLNVRAVEAPGAEIAPALEGGRGQPARTAARRQLAARMAVSWSPPPLADDCGRSAALGSVGAEVCCCRAGRKGRSGGLARRTCAARHQRSARRGRFRLSGSLLRRRSGRRTAALPGALSDRRRGARHVRSAALESLAGKRTLHSRPAHARPDLRLLARFSLAHAARADRTLRIPPNFTLRHSIDRPSSNQRRPTTGSPAPMISFSASAACIAPMMPVSGAKTPITAQRTSSTSSPSGNRQL
jgi:hypothetical protein